MQQYNGQRTSIDIQCLNNISMRTFHIIWEDSLNFEPHAILLRTSLFIQYEKFNKIIYNHLRDDEYTCRIAVCVSRIMRYVI